MLTRSSLTSWLNRIVEKILYLVQSRKFWTLVAALVVVAQMHAAGQVTDWQALQAIIAALAVYSTGVAIDR